MPTERRLAAIMFTDIVGYTALMAESEERGLRARPLVAQHAKFSKGSAQEEVVEPASSAHNCVNLARAPAHSP